MLQEVTAEELQAPLHRLGVLQAAWWLAASRLGSTTSLFRLLSKAEVTGQGWVLHSFWLPTVEYLRGINTCGFVKGGRAGVNTVFVVNPTL